MALTDAQKATIRETVAEIRVEMNGIASAIEAVLSGIRIDELSPTNIDVMNVLQSAKAKVITHSEAIVTLLAPPP